MEFVAKRMYSFAVMPHPEALHSFLLKERGGITLELTKTVDVSFVDNFIETHWINNGAWDSLKNVLTNTDEDTFTIEGKTFAKKDIKSVATDGYGVQFFSDENTEKQLAKSLVW